MLATIVPCCEGLDTLPVLDPMPVSEEVSVPWTQSAASLTMPRAASLSDRLVDRRMSRSSSLSSCATSRLQRLPRFTIFCCFMRSFCCLSLSCTRSRVDNGLSTSGDPLTAETGVKDERGDAVTAIGARSSAKRMACCAGELKGCSGCFDCVVATEGSDCPDDDCTTRRG